MSIDISNPFLTVPVEAAKRIKKAKDSGLRVLYFDECNNLIEEKDEAKAEAQAFYLHCGTSSCRKDVYKAVERFVNKQKEKSETE